MCKTADRGGMVKVPAGSIKQPKQYDMLYILVLNGGDSIKHGKTSHSATFTLVQFVSRIVRDTFSRVKCSSLVNNFSFAVVYYDDKAKVEVNITEAKRIDDICFYDPTVDMGGRSEMSAGLKAAKTLADTFLLNSNQDRKYVNIIVLTDGKDLLGQDSVDIADMIKIDNRVKISMCLLKPIPSNEDDEQKSTLFLKNICSDENYHFRTISDSEHFFSFLIRFVPMRSKII
jgi:uncharacterized protein YegL